MMKRTTKLALLALMSVGLAVCLCGFFGPPEAKLINTREFPVENLLEVEVYYAADKVTLLESTGGKIVLKEYNSYDNPGYHAVVTQKDGLLQIKGGERPKNTTFSARIELFVPADYAGALKLSTASGKIESTDTSLAAAVSLGTASGKIQLSNPGFSLHCTTASGKIEVEGSALEGSVSTASGMVALTASSLGGDLQIGTVSGKAALELAAVPFYLNASTVSGKITNEFTGSFQSGKHSLNGSHGDSPSHTIAVSTVSGKIEINKLYSE